MSSLRHLATTLAIAGTLACGSASAVQRVFVSSTGNDSNAASNCTLAFPCRSFATAFTKVDTGGEIVALDAAGYAVLTIDRSVSIVANPGFYAGITAQTGSAITILPGATNVLLRGLNINALGAAVGINMTGGTNLTIDNCVIANFTTSGVIVNTSAASVKISNTVISGNTQHGLLVGNGKVDVVGSRANGNGMGGFAVETTGAGNTGTLTVTDSTASGNAYGFLAKSNAASSTAHVSITRVGGTTNTDSGFRVEQITGNATGIVGNSTFTENAFGLNNAGGTLRSLGNNVVDFNTNSNTNGTISTVGGL